MVTSGDDNVRRASVSVILLTGLATAARGQAPDAETFFETKIRPVLAGKCFKCHGGKKVSHGLQVGSREALLKGGDSGPAIIPGNPNKSLLIQALRYTHADIKMPPDKQMPAEVVADFAAWVERGAAWPRTTAARTAGFGAQRHWAFVPVKAVSPPPDPAGWSDNPIDRFITAQMRAQHLKPVAAADRRTLLRRVYFDLVGLPPTPDEMTEFLADPAPDAFARVVDRLLAAPHYGERWGRHWMDVVRYADTAGDNADYPVPELHLYRDYIIEAFNTDKPYDQFVREQLAGDLLAKTGPRGKYAERVVASSFVALSRRYATAPYELWPLTLEDTIETTGRAFLGLTLRCARCHDHKFDPVTTKDYYALYGIFASTQYPWAGAEELSSKKMNRLHFVPLLPPGEAAPRLAAFQKQVRGLQNQIADLEKIGGKATRQQQQKLGALRDQLRNLEKPGLPADLPGAYAVQDGKAADVYVQLHGDEHQHGPVVHRDAPAFLTDGHPLGIPAESSGRLELARWLTRPENPLTARVMVNRIWQYHFGKGIVATSSNFGLRGEEPTHPELLDWLASRFTAGGWSVKAMHRLILLSKTYQLASSDDPANEAADPGNRWYWRFDRRRLDAEAIRDALLAVSGRLDRRRPGGHSFPPIAAWAWTQHSPFKDVYPSRHRSVYLMTQRFQRHPYLALFDGPDTNTSTEMRTSSTVPLQALFMMNDPFMVEQADGLARRLLEGPGDSERRIERAYLLALGRAPDPDEIARGVRYLQEYGEQLGRAGAPAERIELEAWTSYARVLLSANEFVYVD
jgi:hypothetical protein